MTTQTLDNQKELSSIDRNGKDLVSIPHTNDSYKVGWLCQRSQELISILDLDYGLKVESNGSKKQLRGKAKIMSKAASYAILNGVKIFFFHWLLWRYFYYIKGYTAQQLLPIIETAKKKALLMESYLGLALVEQMNITKPMMTVEEVEQFRAKLGLELNPASERNTDGL